VYVLHPAVRVKNPSGSECHSMIERHGDIIAIDVVDTVE
jgi:hypothetical protein